MVKINRAALRFGLSVAGVAVGATMLGHLMPPRSSPAVEDASAGTQALRSSVGAVPAGAAAQGMVVENVASGGRLIILARTTDPAAAAPGSMSEAAITNATGAASAAPAASRLPMTRTRRS